MIEKSIGEVCEVIAGQSPESKFYNQLEEGLPFYQGKKEFKEKFIGKPTTWTTKITKEAFKDDILMSVRAPVGPVNFSTENICIGRGLAAIRVKENLDKEYLFYFLIYHENQIIGNKGAVFNSINKNQIENLKIPLPKNIEEQKQIVEILDKAFESIEQAKANIEKNIENTKELFQSRLNEIFSQKGDGWEEKELGKLAEFRNGLNFNKSSKGETFKIVGVSNFKDNFYVDNNSLEEVTIDGKLKELDLLKDGDIVAVRSNGNPNLIGRCMLLENIEEKISFSGFTIRIRLIDKNIYPLFLNYFLKSHLQIIKNNP